MQHVALLLLPLGCPVISACCMLTIPPTNSVHACWKEAICCGGGTSVNRAGICVTIMVLQQPLLTRQRTIHTSGGHHVLETVGSVIPDANVCQWSCASPKVTPNTCSCAPVKSVALHHLLLLPCLFTSGLRLVEAICSGHLEGGAVRSTAITFTPGATAAGTYTADTKTAGSCTLMVQQALPCLLLARQQAAR